MRVGSFSCVLGLALAAALATADLGLAQDAPSLKTSFFARSMQPGEVVRLDVTCACGDAQPTATALGADVALFPIADPTGRPVGRPVRRPVRRSPKGEGGSPKGEGGSPEGDGGWRGLIGVDLDTKPGRYAVVVTVEQPGRPRVVSTRLLNVIAKRFTVRRLRVADRFVDPPASARERIEREARLMASLFAVETPRMWDGAFRLPVAQRPVSNFGARSVFNGRPRNPHAGVDFGSPTGTPIVAPGAGHIVLAEALFFTGNTVIIDHGLGLYSVFAHLSRFEVEKGDRVERDTSIGLVGATGRVTGPHLHWSVRLQGRRVDPLSLVAALNTLATKRTKAKSPRRHEDTKFSFLQILRKPILRAFVPSWRPIVVSSWPMASLAGYSPARRPALCRRR